VARPSPVAGQAGSRRKTARGSSDRVARRPIEGGLPELDRVIHERLRLGIVSALAVNERLTFKELKALMRTTDGNLSVHARRLEEAEYVACTKTFQGRVPRTTFRLTPLGRRALERYLQHMEGLIRAARSR